MEVKDKVKFLKSTSLCENLNADEIEMLAENGNVKEFPKKSTIFIQSEPGEIFYILKSGMVKITKIDENGNEVIFAILSSGDFFGEMSIIDNDVRSANAITITDVVLLTYSKAAFFKFIQESFNFTMNLLKIFTVRVRNTDTSIKSLFLDTAQKRILVNFNLLVKKSGYIEEGQMIIDEIVNQADLANFCGTSRETLSRTLKKLENNGLLVKNGKQIRIPDYRRFVKTFGLAEN
ncbi:MAG: Crp/Fnr family transcriptional regulator [Candidatus Delongbacteria bacterium]|nr:Crp/Fnr family transcriptional regulator [Candidatus Delongbacteria bacterium]MBN2834236.1 Crp/Fnr family transcriptional regulator [Candidatus Delongbacteria bacterium]